jgi:hypothetical protein
MLQRSSPNKNQNQFHILACRVYRPANSSVMLHDAALSRLLTRRGSECQGLHVPHIEMHCDNILQVNKPGKQSVTQASNIPMF